MPQRDDVIRELLAGNEHYRRGETRPYGLPIDRDALVGEQRPIAAVLTCSEYRVVFEHLLSNAVRENMRTTVERLAAAVRARGASSTPSKARRGASDDV